MKKPRPWKPYRRKRAVRKLKANRTYLDAFEEAVILRDIASFGGSYVTARELRLKFPMRYGSYLNTRLKNMAVGKMWGRPQLDRRRIGLGGTAFAYKLTEVETIKREAA